MNHQSQYEIESQPSLEPRSDLTVRVTLYDRALKQAIFEFLALEKLSIEKTTLDDGCINYEITRVQQRSLSRLEQMLRSATRM
jgi:hypothetical protein